jgi:hypothetical protein
MSPIAAVVVGSVVIATLSLNLNLRVEPSVTSVSEQDQG